MKTTKNKITYPANLIVSFKVLKHDFEVAVGPKKCGQTLENFPTKFQNLAAKFLLKIPIVQVKCEISFYIDNHCRTKFDSEKFHGKTLKNVNALAF